MVNSHSAQSMNVYDFDKTIFYPDCTFSFIEWCLGRNPLLAKNWLSKMSRYCFLFSIGMISRDALERQLLKFFKNLPDPHQEVLEYWKEHRLQMSPWYLLQKKPDDLIISASPEFIVKPMIDELGVRLLATQFDLEKGEIIGTSCYGKRKIEALIKSGIYPDESIDNFYSDALSDTPLALCADHAFLVTKKAKVPIPWPSSHFLKYIVKRRKNQNKVDGQ